MHTTLRRRTTEIAYREACRLKQLPGLQDEPSLREWEHWRLVNNRYPYDIAFKKHHMLVPKRLVGSRLELTSEEQAELSRIIEEYCEPNYHLVFLNMGPTRSVLDMFHLHLASYWNTREEMVL